MKDFDEFEEYFSCNNYNGAEYKGANYIYKKGRLPVIISVPHSVFQIREGALKNPEVYTGAIGVMLHKYSGAHIIAKCLADKEDPNYDKESAYCNKLIDVVRENNINLMLDIHGSKRSHPFSIDVGTNKGTLASEGTVKTFKDSFSKNPEIPFTITENLIFGATGENRVVNKIHRSTGIEAMQLEISQLYRNPTKNYEYFNELIKNLCSFIEEVSLSKIELL